MKMKWEKKGLIYTPPYDGSWRDNSALTPSAFLMSEQVIRVYAGFRDQYGVSRIGYVDVSAQDPKRILAISDTPVLDVGNRGMFDDNGVILGEVLRVGENVYLYYIGFQLTSKVKFLAYTGLAVSSDNGQTFERFSETPVLDRADEGKYIRAIHSVCHEDGIFKVFYACGNGWEVINGIEYPQYDISYIESHDGISFPRSGQHLLANDNKNLEYRIGRPRVYKMGDTYIMNFTFGTTDGRYQTGQAFSRDGKSWDRHDDSFGIFVSESGWDSKHLSYPSVITLPNKKTYMFYNGNDMGRDGFGGAELISVELD